MNELPARGCRKIGRMAPGSETQKAASLSSSARRPVIGVISGGLNETPRYLNGCTGVAPVDIQWPSR